MNEIAEGDIVVLKSGGPRMTVGKLTTSGGKNVAQCTWFEGKTPQHQGFYVHMLIKVEAGERTPVA